MEQKQKATIERSILLLPLLVAFVWMSSTILTVGDSESGSMLAPSKLDSLVNALFIFIIGYTVVLGFMFFHMNKKMKEEEIIRAKYSFKSSVKPIRKKRR